MNLISIIVPVYGVEKYLRKCVNSITSQTYKNIEIILVNDGSKDLSGKICDELAKQDKRIVVLHQKNKGQSAARNAGLKICTGNYVTFVDSDDFIEDNMIEFLYGLINKTSADISVCSFNTIQKNGKNYDQSTKKNIEFIYNAEESIKSMFYVKGFASAVWNKLYNIKLFDEINFPENIIAEDFVVNCLAMDKSKKIVYSDKKLYNYVVHENSSIHGQFSKNMFGALTGKDLVLSLLQEKYPSVFQMIKSRYPLSAVKIINSMAASRHKNRNDYALCYAYIKKYFWDFFMSSKISILKKIFVLLYIILSKRIINSAIKGGLISRVCFKIKNLLH